MSYSYNVTITVPASQAEVAAKIGRALDPDSGGAASFMHVILGYTGGDDPQPIFGDNIFVSTPCRAEFAAQVPVMLANPAVLHGAVCADYAKRWPDETPPTLAECIAFCGSVIPEPQQPAAGPVV